MEFLSQRSDPSHNCDLYATSFNPWWQAGDQTCVPAEIPLIPFHHCGNSLASSLIFFLFRAAPTHMEVPRLWVESELHLLAFATATATWDPSCICDLHQSSQQCWILNPLSEARDRTHILMDTSRVYNPLSHSGNSPRSSFVIAGASLSR